MDEIARLAADLVTRCRDAGLMLATAESCTGGMVAAAITDIAGSSAVLERGFVTYSNAAKEALLGVPSSLLAAHGAVSRETAKAMARGALANAPVQLAVSITGIAGPGGGSPEKPVGLVHFASASAAGVTHVRKEFGDLGRTEIRLRSVVQALTMLLDAAAQAGVRRP